MLYRSSDNLPPQSSHRAIYSTPLGASTTSLIGEQVRHHGHAPFAYFKRVFERLPGTTNQDDFAPPLPCNWVAAQKELRDKAE